MSATLQSGKLARETNQGGADMAKSSDSKISRFSEQCAGERITVGVDVHKHSYHVALLSRNGVSDDFSMPSDNSHLTQLLLRLPVTVDCVAYEAGPTGFSLARSLASAGIPVIVAAPTRIPRPIGPSNKTDRLDCRKLADFASRGLLRSIAIPSEWEESFRCLVRRYHQLTDDMRKTKQRIKGFLLYMGLKEPAGLHCWSQASLRSLEELTLHPGGSETRDNFLRHLRYLESDRKQIHGQIQEVIRAENLTDRLERLQSVWGVGPILGMTFAAEVFRPERFHHKTEVAAYLGLAPMVQQSGSRTSPSRLRPAGKTRLRSLLIECAWIWRQHESEAQDVYQRILSRNGIPQKAITAVARRLAVKLWKLSLPPKVA